MAFIGIITSNKNEEILKKSVLNILKNSQTKHNVIVINEENIGNMKNIKFNSIIMNKENNIKENKKIILKQILKNTKYLIVNSDVYTRLDMITKINISIITNGYNLKATVTASSINEEKILLCIQRNIKVDNKIDIEPKEMYAQILANDVYITMAANIVKLLYY